MLVRRLLEVIAGKNAESAAILRERLVDGVLRAKVGDGVFVAQPLPFAVGRGEVVVQLPRDLVDLGQVLTGARQPLEARGLSEEGYGGHAGIEALGIDLPEQVEGFRVPRPVHVERDLLEGLKGCWKLQVGSGKGWNPVQGHCFLPVNTYAEAYCGKRYGV